MHTKYLLNRIKIIKQRQRQKNVATLEWKWSHTYEHANWNTFFYPATSNAIKEKKYENENLLVSFGIEKRNRINLLYAKCVLDMVALTAR